MRGDTTPRPPETYIIVQQRLLAARQATSSEQTVPSLPVLLPSSRTRGRTVSAILCHGSWWYLGGRIQVENKTQSLLSNKLLLESAVHGTAFTKRIHHWAWKSSFAQVLGGRFFRQRCSSLTTCVNQFSAQTKLSPLSQDAALEVRPFVCLTGCFYFYFSLFWRQGLIL